MPGGVVVEAAAIIPTPYTDSSFLSYIYDYPESRASRVPHFLISIERVFWIVLIIKHPVFNLS